MLAPGSLGKGVVAEPQSGHEDRRLMYLAGVAVVNGNGGAGIIDKQFFAGVVLLAIVLQTSENPRTPNRLE